MNPRQDDSALRLACTRQLSGHPVLSPGEELARIGAWCREHGHHADNYGEGALLGAFEAKVAALLGMEASVFMMSGTMAQLIALRIWAERGRRAHVAMHPTSHLELHEERAYEHLHGLRATLVGARQRPMLASDLAAFPEPFSALLVELPVREAGGRLPGWDELCELATLARKRGIRLHLDGARLWESSAFYGKGYPEICARFDSVYVSFYKGIGALAGAMLLGPADFVDEARIWRKRHGGTLVQMHPFVASAARSLDAQLAKMPAYFERARRFAAALSNLPDVVVEPSPPHVNMLHVHFPVSADALKRARDRVAAEDGMWIAPRVRTNDTPSSSYIEIYAGENLMAMTDAEAVAILAKLLAFARA